MKKLLLILGILFLMPTGAFCADSIIPEYVSVNYNDTFGLYQVPNEIILYQEPSETSNMIHSISWIGSQIYPEAVNPKDVFVVYLPEKNLAFMAVSDETEDWVQVIYNSKTGSKGWLKKDDPYRFTSWVMFYNMYGRKYGLKLLKEAPAGAAGIRTVTPFHSLVRQVRRSDLAVDQRRHDIRHGRRPAG